MQSFIQYLESKKKTYSFKIKLAGDYTDCKEKVEFILNPYKLVKISDPRRTPIQDCALDFPMVKNTCVTILDIEVSYPTTPQVLGVLFNERLGIEPCCIVVQATNEYAEDCVDIRTETSTNHEECKDPQELVGQRRISDLLKSLQSGNVGVKEPVTATPEIQTQNISPIGSK